LVCALVLGVVPVMATPPVAQQAGSLPQAEPMGGQQPSTPQSMRQQQEQQQQQAAPQGQVFRGTMMLKSGQYFFQDDSTNSTYKVDHQADLKKFDLNGKKVQIVGTLDSSSRLIHITRIALVRAGNNPSH
jgi:uncharacterized protein YdeI (BOF family)